MEGLSIRDIVYVALAIAAGFGAWYALRGQVQEHSLRLNNLKEEVDKNEERIRDDFSKQETRVEKRLGSIDDNIHELDTHRLASDNRLTTIESDSAHTRRAVDEMKSDLKDIMQQVTSVATTLTNYVTGTKAE